MIETSKQLRQRLPVPLVRHEKGFFLPEAKPIEDSPRPSHQDTLRQGDSHMKTSRTYQSDCWRTADGPDARLAFFKKRNHELLNTLSTRSLSLASNQDVNFYLNNKYEDSKKHTSETQGSEHKTSTLGSISTSRFGNKTLRIPKCFLRKFSHKERVLESNFWAVPKHTAQPPACIVINRLPSEPEK